MSLRQIGFAFSLFLFLTPVFAIQCPPAEQVRYCSGSQCSFQRIAGWSGTVYFTDQGKPFEFQKKLVDGRETRCYYTYFDSDTNRLMPPALVLRTTIN